MLTHITEWIDEVSGSDVVWYVKRLSANDTLANKSHQAGPYVQKDFLFQLFPDINKKSAKNPRVKFNLSIDSHADNREITAIWYNNKFHGGTRNETRLTNFGGDSSPLLDPESTGALTIFVFVVNGNGEAKECKVWVCRDETEEDIIEERIGPVEPGKWKIWSFVQKIASEGFANTTKKPRTSCWLQPHEIPAAWLKKFPSPVDIILKTKELHSDHGVQPDLRLIKRRECEFEIFKSVEETIEPPLIKQGFGSINDFMSKAQTIVQRRKARSGRSLELHTKEIFVEEGLRDTVDFSYNPESEPGKNPDFLFPNEAAYKNSSFSESKLLMLAVKTTCKDRWRQILNEADRVKRKHLLTLQEGVSENQFKEMKQADVQLVVPAPLLCHYPKSVQPHLQTLESFIGDIRLICIK